MALAEHVSAWSKDRSTKLGAVIVDDQKRIVSIGYNGFPRGVDDDIDERHERPQKYLWTEHAERNAIYNAREPLKGTTLYVPWNPCVDCARAIIQVGIERVVMSEARRSINANDEHFGFDIASQMLQEAGVRLDLVSGSYTTG